MRILSIDYGKRRTGIAVTDSMQIIANGLTTVDTKKLFVFLKDYFEKESVERVILGLPTQTNGQPSENQQRVRLFAANFTKQFPHQTMLASGIGKQRRRDKALVDEISACIILQSYMESKRNI